MSSRKKKSPAVFSAAGLVRYYEETDVGIKLSPYVAIGLMVGFTVAVIVLSKLLPLPT